MSEQGQNGGDGAPTHVPSDKPGPSLEDIAAVVNLKAGVGDPGEAPKPDVEQTVNTYLEELDKELTPKPFSGPELDKMISDLGGKPAPTSDAPPTEGKPEEKDLPPEGAGVPDTSGKPADQPSDEVKSLKAQIETLTGLLASQSPDLAAILPSLQSGGSVNPALMALLAPKPAAPEPAAPKPEAPEEISIDVTKIFDGAEIDLNEPANLNKLLQHVANVAVESAMLRVPGVVTANITNELTMRRKADQFYADNPDLASHRLIIGRLADQLSAGSPKADFDQILSLVAPLARSVLGLPVPTGKSDEGGAHDKPGIGTRVARRGEAGVKLSEQQRQIAHLISKGAAGR
jgi:hypothetical protein